MKKLLEIFIVVFVLGLIIYSLLYFFYFDDKCNSYSGNSNSNLNYGIIQIASCKDSFICEVSDVENNEKNIPKNWSCEKKEAVIYKLDFYKSIGEDFINSITK